jgi:hypothetical protein
MLNLVASFASSAGSPYENATRQRAEREYANRQEQAAQVKSDEQVRKLVRETFDDVQKELDAAEVSSDMVALSSLQQPIFERNFAILTRQDENEFLSLPEEEKQKLYKQHRAQAKEAAIETKDELTASMGDFSSTQRSLMMSSLDKIIAGADPSNIGQEPIEAIRFFPLQPGKASMAKIHSGGFLNRVLEDHPEIDPDTLFAVAKRDKQTRRIIKSFGGAKQLRASETPFDAPIGPPMAMDGAKTPSKLDLALGQQPYPEAAGPQVPTETPSQPQQTPQATPPQPTAENMVGQFLGASPYGARGETVAPPTAGPDATVVSEELANLFSNLARQDIPPTEEYLQMLAITNPELARQKRALYGPPPKMPEIQHAGPAGPGISGSEPVGNQMADLASVFRNMATRQKLQEGLSLTNQEPNLNEMLKREAAQELFLSPDQKLSDLFSIPGF